MNTKPQKELQPVYEETDRFMIVHSPRSTDFTSLCSTASNTTSCASRLRCFRQVPVVDPGRFARGISSVSIAHAQHGVGSSSI